MLINIYASKAMLLYILSGASDEALPRTRLSLCVCSSYAYVLQDISLPLYAD